MTGDDDLGATVFRDMTLLALAGVVAIVLLLLPWLNPRGAQETSVAQPAGGVIVELFWPDGVDADADLWVLAPGDGPVGFSNMAGHYFNLLRDDLGATRDATPLNYEIAYTRGVAPGEYIANVHLYRAAPDRATLPVTAAVSAVRPGRRAREQLLTRDYLLTAEGEEITAARFSLDAEGKLVPGSVHYLPRSLIGRDRGPVYARPREEEA